MSTLITGVHALLIKTLSIEEYYRFDTSVCLLAFKDEHKYAGKGNKWSRKCLV